MGVRSLIQTIIVTAKSLTSTVSFLPRRHEETRRHEGEIIEFLCVLGDLVLFVVLGLATLAVTNSLILSIVFVAVSVKHFFR